MTAKELISFSKAVSHFISWINVEQNMLKFRTTGIWRLMFQGCVWIVFVVVLVCFCFGRNICWWNKILCFALRRLKLFRLIMAHRLQRMMLVTCQWTIFTLFIWNVQISRSDGDGGASYYVKHLNSLINIAVICLTLPVYFRNVCLLKMLWSDIINKQ